MTRKKTLISWAEQLGIVSDSEDGENYTVAALEDEIEAAIREKTAAAQQVSGFTFREGLDNNLRVLRQELPGAVKAVARQFL